MSRSTDNILTLDVLAKHCWRTLDAAAQERQHPWRTPAIATRTDAHVALRTVVLRAVNHEAGTLIFHTDRRSAKAHELAQSPWLAWLFWDANRQEQLRCEGPASLYQQDGFAQAQWRSLPIKSRETYAQGQAPGTDLSPDAAALTRQNQSTHADATDAAFAHFLVVQCRIERMDWLHLDPKGHRRAELTHSPAGWTARWVAP